MSLSSRPIKKRGKQKQSPGRWNTLANRLKNLLRNTTPTKNTQTIEIKDSPNNRRQSPRNNSYQKDLAKFASLRNSGSMPSTSQASTTIPNDELIWVRGGSGGPQELPPIPLTARVDDEIEDGEIVESEATGIVSLLEESLSAVTRSKQIGNLMLSPPKPFFEDRSSLKNGMVPKYFPFGSAPANKENVDDDVICLDSSNPDVDDSVMFVSEEQLPLVGKLTTPECLKTSAVKKLLKLIPPQSVQQTSGRRVVAKRTSSPQKIKRFKMWRDRKRVEMAGNKETTSQPRPSTSSGPPQQQLPKKVTPKQSAKEAVAGQLMKRIILIDASNVAFAYTDEYGSRKTDADYSAEGLKIAIDYFEDLGFQVKAILPEFRIRRDKSSNHEIMMQLKDTGKLMCTPSKSYDDRVILEAAVRFDAAVVSNDHYRDLLNEKPEFREVTSRIIRFNWLFKQLIVPEDPHGRNGPQLKDILYKTAP